MVKEFQCYDRKKCLKSVMYQLTCLHHTYVHQSFYFCVEFFYLYAWFILFLYLILILEFIRFIRSTMKVWSFNRFEFIHFLFVILFFLLVHSIKISIRSGILVSSFTSIFYVISIRVSMTWLFYSFLSLFWTKTKQKSWPRKVPKCNTCLL